MQTPVKILLNKSVAVGLAIVLLLGAVGYRGVVLADPSTITVAPAFLRVSVSKNQPRQDESIGVRNDSSVSVRLSAQLVGVDEQSANLAPKGEPKLALTNAVHLSVTDLTIPPGQSSNIGLSFENSDQLAPGGHYAAVLITQISSGEKGISLQSVVSVALFLTKEDGAVRALQMAPSALPKIGFSLPRQLTLSAKNEGNVQLTPRASVTIAANSTVYAKAIANEGSLPIFPGNTLRLETRLNQLKRTSWLPKSYVFQVMYRYDGESIQSSSIQKIWVFPPVFLIVLSLGALLVSAFRHRIWHSIRSLLLKKPEFFKRSVSDRPK